MLLDMLVLCHANGQIPQSRCFLLASNLGRCFELQSHMPTTMKIWGYGLRYLSVLDKKRLTSTNNS